MGKQRRLLDEYHFPGFRPRSEIQGIFGDPCARVIRLKRVYKRQLRMLRYGTSEPLRQESAADTGSVLWECPDILGSGGTESQVQEVRDLSLIHISEPTRLGMISYAVFCLKKKKKKKKK